MRITYYRSSPGAFFVNSYIIELEASVIVVDTQFVLPEAHGLVAAVKQSGKPVSAVMLTHPHPDHVNGTQLLLNEWPGIPVYSTDATSKAIVEIAEPKRHQWKPILGDAYPDTVVTPTNIVADGGVVSIDGVSFKFYDVGALESINESIIEVPSERVAFIGDLLYNKVHPWLIEGRSLAWRRALDGFSTSLSHLQILYPGHGDPCTVDAIRAQANYMDTFFGLVRAFAAGESKDDIVARVKSMYPNWELDLLIPINLDAVLEEVSA